MTRVNLIPVDELYHKHLVAEYRENPRIFGLVRKAQARGVRPDTVDAPSVYTLGPGHVKFFYPRLNFLIDRQNLLIKEMLRRGYAPSNTNVFGLVDGIHGAWFRDWTPTAADVAVSRARITEKLRSMGVIS